MDKLTSKFIAKENKSTQKPVVIDGRRSDDLFKFDLLSLIEWGLRALAVTVFCLFAWWIV